MVRTGGTAFAQSSRELKDPRHELRGLHALRAVLALGSGGAGGVVLFGGGLQELACEGRALDGGGVAGPEHGGEVQGVRRRRWLPRVARASASLSHASASTPASTPAGVVTKHRKHPSQTPDHLSRPACHVPAGTRSPGHNHKIPDYLPSRSRATRGKSSLVGHRRCLRASMPGLISSRIRLRPGIFGLQHLRPAAQATDPLDLRAGLSRADCESVLGGNPSGVRISHPPPR